MKIGILQTGHSDKTLIQEYGDFDDMFKALLGDYHFSFETYDVVDSIFPKKPEDADGWLIDSFYSHLIQYKNWDIYLGGGATLYSSGVVDYYLGVNLNEANQFRPQHQGDVVVRLQSEIFVQYPIAQSWSFGAGITQNYYSKNAVDSPLADKQHLTQVLIGVMYVF